MTNHSVPKQASLHQAVAFGDSVMWGQGVNHDEKFATRIAREVFSVDLPRSAVIDQVDA